MKIWTGALIETLQACSAMTRWVSCNIFNTQDHAEAGFAKAGTDTLSAASSPSSLLCTTPPKISMVIPCVFLGGNVCVMIVNDVSCETEDGTAEASDASLSRWVFWTICELMRFDSFVGHS